MKFQTHNDAEIDISMTRLAGYIQATRAELNKTFGVPILGGADNKVSLSWHLKFEDGEVATIYAWMRPEPNVDEVYGYHIGESWNCGANMVYRVHEAFRKDHGFIGSMVRKAA